MKPRHIRQSMCKTRLECVLKRTRRVLDIYKKLSYIASLLNVLVSLSQLGDAKPLAGRAVANVTPETFAKTSFDYIVVGGGTAGLVVAARLSEDPKVTVGVIEAGLYRPNDPKIDVPFNAPQIVGNPDYDWNFFSTPQRGLNNRQVPLNRGKVLGGSSAINAVTFHRPSGTEFDAWATTFGNGNQWSWKNVEPYFKKAENWTGPPPLVFPGQAPSNSLVEAHGKGGPMQISYNNFFPDELVKAVGTAGKLGLTVTNDPDSGDGTGLFNVPRAVDPHTGKRQYSAVGYYTPFANRPNYVVLTNAHATKLDFATSSKSIKATGVNFVRDGKSYTVKARKEIILSAGAFKTPQLLELSGVGNATFLKSHGIKPVLDLPYVGENYFDHGVTFGDSIAKPGQITLDTLRWNATYNAEQQALFNATGQGAISHTAAAIATVPPQKLIAPEILRKMKQDLVAKNHIFNTPLKKIQYEDNLARLDEGKVGWGAVVSWPGGGQASVPADGNLYFGHHVLNYRPFSRGSVHINSTDPLASPLLDPDFLGEDFDAEFCAHQLIFVNKWTATSPLADVLSGPHVPPADLDTVEELKEHCRQTTGTTWHPMGSTAMAPLAKGGVVNNRLVVHGLANVRIVDAGIIPQALGAAPQATVYMIAEKAADFIKQDAARL